MAALVVARHRPVLERGDLAIYPALLELERQAACLVGGDPLGFRSRPQLGMERRGLGVLGALVAGEIRTQAPVVVGVEVLVAQLARPRRRSWPVEHGRREEHPLEAVAGVD